jgi:exopolysaccharide biosynthesis predicted pyruvyltransferase EpsI
MAQPSTVTVLDRLSGQVRDAVRAAIAPGSRCALLGYPNHTNPGDHAIWIAAKALLERIGAEVTYECSWCDYSREALGEAVGAGAHIVFSGGGNFGDLWPATHALREAVLRDCAGVPIVQLPQTVHFTRREALDATRRSLERHGNVVLLVRDAPSLILARGSFDVDVRLAPDLAFACPVDPMPEPPTTDVLWIAREDRESCGLNPDEVPDGTWRVDWNLRDAERRPLDGEAPLPESLLALIERNRRLTKYPAGDGWRELAEIRETLSRARLARALRLLRRGRVVVTDALHAQVLSLMLGIPTVITDTRYGKLRATFDTFTHAVPLAHWADTPEQALGLATRLVPRFTP